MQTTTINGLEYQIDYFGDDIIITGLNFDKQMILEGGYKELKDSAESDTGYEVRGLEDEDNFYFDDNVVKELIMNRIEDYIQDNIDKLKIVEP